MKLTRLLQLDRKNLAALALPALATTLGLQSIRVLFPSLTWVLADAHGAGPLTLTAVAFASFFPAVFAPLLRRLAGRQRSLTLAAGGLAVLRLAEQLNRDPFLDLWLAAGATAFFVVFLPLWISRSLSGGDQAAPHLAAGPLLGLTLDSAVRQAAGTLDLSWIQAPLPLALTGLLAGAAIALSARAPDAYPAAAPPLRRAAPLVALGPALVLDCVIFQSQGWIAAVTGLEAAQAGLVLMLGNAAALAGMGAGFASGFALRRLLASGLGATLVLAVLGADQVGPSLAAAVVLVQAALGWGWGLVAANAVSGRASGEGHTELVVAAGLLLFLVLSFLYYGALQIDIGLPRSGLLAAAAGLVALGMMLAAWLARRQAIGRQPGWGGLALAALLALPAGADVLIGGPRPGFAQPAGFPMRVMTYNIHSAYNVRGRQDPEAIARVIEAARPDLVVLQEVSRGWLVDGGTDLPAWLSHRLGMPFLFRGTSDPVWGNALLSRLPVLASGWAGLPQAGTLLPRGLLWAQLEVGPAQPILVLATHLHHIEEDHSARQAQVTALLSHWQGRPYSLLIGDLNAQPDDPELAGIREAGWIDSWAEAGDGLGLTWPATDPAQRIDWIWHTPDLAARQAIVVDSLASDHRPVLATIDQIP